MVTSLGLRPKSTVDEAPEALREQPCDLAVIDMIPNSTRKS
jgi:hypothetical protein